MSVWQKIVISMGAGAGGALVGSPADVVLVRMQADGRLPPEQRRNYKNAIEGLIRLTREDGVVGLFKGVGPNIQRAMLMSGGQLAAYDQSKQMLLQTPFFEEDFVTHIT